MKVFVERVLRDVLWFKKEVTGDKYMIWGISVCGIVPNKCY